MLHPPDRTKITNKYAEKCFLIYAFLCNKSKRHLNIFSLLMPICPLSITHSAPMKSKLSKLQPAESWVEVGFCWPTAPLCVLCWILGDRSRRSMSAVIPIMQMNSQHLRSHHQGPDGKSKDRETWGVTQGINKKKWRRDSPNANST